MSDKQFIVSEAKSHIQKGLNIYTDEIKRLKKEIKVLEKINQELNLSLILKNVHLNIDIKIAKKLKVECRDFIVMSLYYGIFGADRKYTLKEIGEIIGEKNNPNRFITRNSVKSIIAKTLRNLRRSPRVRYIEEYPFETKEENDFFIELFGRPYKRRIEESGLK